MIALVDVKTIPSNWILKFKNVSCKHKEHVVKQCYKQASEMCSVYKYDRSLAKRDNNVSVARQQTEYYV